jgi:hypothetical protein
MIAAIYCRSTTRYSIPLVLVLVASHLKTYSAEEIGPRLDERG